MAEAGRRFVIGIGVSDYDDTDMSLKSVPADVAEVTRFFAEHPRVAHERALETLKESPTNEEIRTTLSRWFKQQNPEDVVVVYIAAHGEVEGNKSYVQGRDSPRNGLAGLAVNGDDLGSIIGQADPHNVLIIVDTCVAGRLGSAIQRQAEDIADDLNTRQPDRTWALAIVCSTYGRDPAQDGRFASAFLTVVNSERWTGTTNEWISIDTLMTGLNHELRDMGVPQVAERRTSGPGASELIPNPNFGKRPPGDLIADHEFTSHFDPSARGASPGETGWYFSGRTEELATIAKWLRMPREGVDHSGMLIITGPPGSGKSALLSRVIVLSDATLRGRVPDCDDLPPETMPPSDAIEAVIWCHNKTLEKVVAELCGRLGVSAATAEEFIGAIESREVTVAVDALDEAIEGHAERIASQLLKPLARLPGAKVMVATRPHPVGFASDAAAATLLDHLGSDQAVSIVLDKVGNRVADMQNNVADRLMAKAEPGRTTPYSGQPDLAKAVAQRVVAAAGSSFLVAVVTAKALAARDEPVDPDALDLTLPTEAGAAMMNYIERLPEPELIHHVLRPLAWARGRGLPWAPYWVPFANALAEATPSASGPPDVDDAAIARVLDRAGDLVIESTDEGEPAYRLFHEALAEHLRSETEPEVAHGAMVETILNTTGLRPPYDTEHPYAIAHLASHLALAPDLLGYLHTLVTRPDWERAKRRLTGNSISFLGDIDIYLEQALKSKPRDIVSLVGASLVYSRMMSTAPPQIVGLFGRAVQLPRAELMAGNITHALDRCKAFCLLAPFFDEEKDIDGVMRCLEEAMSIAVGSIDRTHSSMAYCWIAETAKACGFDRAASSAAGRSVKAALDLPGADLDWELANGIFWAGRALRSIGDNDRLEDLKAVFREQFEDDYRNQTLQAASVLGEREWLKKAFSAYRDGYRYPSIIRDGNLALALADAEMTEEAQELFAFVEGAGGSQGEADSQKRYAWALALVGRYDDALDHADRIDAAEERAGAMVCIVEIAADQHAKGILDQAATRIANEIVKEDWRSQAILAPALYIAGDADTALYIAEELAFRDDAGETSGPFYAIHTDENGDLRGKTARRPLQSRTFELEDANREEDVRRHAERGESDQALNLLSEISVPLFRARALFAIAQAEEDPALRLDLWIDSIVEARKVGHPTLIDAVNQARRLFSGNEDLIPFQDLQLTLDELEARWTLASFSEQYETLRDLFPSGPQRTRRMTAMVNVARSKGVKVNWRALKVGDLLESGSEGERIFAIGLMQANPDLADNELIIDTIDKSASAFEQFHALRVLSALVPDLTEQQMDRVLEIFARERETNFDDERNLRSISIERKIKERRG